MQAAYAALLAVLVPGGARGFEALAGARQRLFPIQFEFILERRDKVAVLRRVELAVERQQPLLVVVLAAGPPQLRVVRGDSAIAFQLPLRRLAPARRGKLLQQHRRRFRFTIAPCLVSLLVARQHRLRGQQAGRNILGPRAERWSLELRLLQGALRLQPVAGTQIFLDVQIAIQVALQSLRTFDARIARFELREHRDQVFSLFRLQLVLDRRDQPLDGGKIKRLVALQRTLMAEHPGTQFGECRHLLHDGRQRTMVGIGIRLPPAQQCLDAILLAEHHQRRVRPASFDHVLLQPGHPLHDVEVVRGARIGPGQVPARFDTALCGGEIPVHHRRRPVRRSRLEQRLGGQGTDVAFVPVTLQVATRRQRRLPVLAAVQQLADIALRCRGDVHRRSDTRDCDQHQAAQPAPPRALFALLGKGAARFAQRSAQADERRTPTARRSRAGGRGVRLRGLLRRCGVLRLLLAGGILDAEDIQKGIRRADEGRPSDIVDAGRLGGQVGGGIGSGLRRLGIGVDQFRAIHETVAAKCNHITAVQLTRVLLEPLAADIGTVGAAQVLDVKAVVAREDVRVAARQIAQLVGQPLAVAGENLAFLIDQKRELTDDHRLQQATTVFGLQQQLQRCRHRRRTTLFCRGTEQLRLVAQAGKTQLVTRSQFHRYLIDALAVHRGAVETAKIGEVNHAVLLENTRVAPRQPRHQPRIVSRERFLVPADGEQGVVDNNVTQLGLGNRLENELHPALCLSSVSVIGRQPDRFPGPSAAQCLVQSDGIGEDLPVIGEHLLLGIQQ